MGGVFLCPTPAKARRAVPEDASTFPRVLPPRPSRVRERFHGDIIVSLSFCAFARDAWTVTEMGAGDDPAPGRRENHPLARGNRESSGESSAPRASRGERPHRAHRFASTACVCRSTSVRRHASIDSNHPIEESRSSRPTSPRVPLNSFSSPSPLDARALAVCRLFSRAFRSSRSSVPSASPSVVFPVPRVVLPPLPPPRFPPRLASVSSPGRARCRDIGIFIRSFGWTRCSVLRVMTRECTRAQTTTSYDSRYMECTPGYIRWRSSRRLESRRRRRTDDARDRGRDDETFPSPGDGDDRTTSPSVRVIQPSSRVCLDSFSFRALANRMNDRPTIRGENAVPPLASRSSIVRVVRVVPTSTSTSTSARAVARTAPNATRRRAPARIVHSNRPESSRPPPFDCRSRPVFFLFTSV